MFSVFRLTDIFKNQTEKLFNQSKELFNQTGKLIISKGRDFYAGIKTQANTLLKKTGGVITQTGRYVYSKLPAFIQEHSDPYITDLSSEKFTTLFFDVAKHAFNLKLLWLIKMQWRHYFYDENGKAIHPLAADIDNIISFIAFFYSIKPMIVIAIAPAALAQQGNSAQSIHEKLSTNLTKISFGENNNEYDTEIIHQNCSDRNCPSLKIQLFSAVNDIPLWIIFFQLLPKIEKFQALVFTLGMIGRGALFTSNSAPNKNICANHRYLLIDENLLLTSLIAILYEVSNISIKNFSACVNNIPYVGIISPIISGVLIEVLALIVQRISMTAIEKSPIDLDLENPHPFYDLTNYLAQFSSQHLPKILPKPNPNGKLVDYFLIILGKIYSSITQSDTISDYLQQVFSSPAIEPFIRKQLEGIIEIFESILKIKNKSFLVTLSLATAEYLTHFNTFLDTALSQIAKNFNIPEKQIPLIKKIINLIEQNGGLEQSILQLKFFVEKLQPNSGFDIVDMSELNLHEEQNAHFVQNGVKIQDDYFVIKTFKTLTY
ncbi:MAG: hypothetical protein KIT27_01195 [Legionellales bacterium]|nr:hypothetical protein [Legionellales bacterium]